MKKRITFSVLLIAALLSGLTTACKPKSAEKITIIAADCGWDSQLLHNALAKLVIEHAYEGYELKSSTASTTMNWESIKNNDVDLQIETWTDNLPTYPED